jgi:uncharacterized protein YecT (DUF1311 family)
VSEVFTPLPCTADTTIGMDGCAEHRVLRADMTINRDLKRLWRTAANNAARAHIAAAQAAWQDYRKAACLSESDAYAGGTLSTVIGARCLARITETRAAELDQQGRLGP